MISLEEAKRLERELAETERLVSAYDALDLLKVNPQFNNFIEYYTEVYAKQLIASMSPLVKRGHSVDTITTQLVGISHLLAFITKLEHEGNSAKGSSVREEE